MSDPINQTMKVSEKDSQYSARYIEYITRYLKVKRNLKTARFDPETRRNHGISSDIQSGSLNEEPMTHTEMTNSVFVSPAARGRREPQKAQRPQNQKSCKIAPKTQIFAPNDTIWRSATEYIEACDEP